MHDIPDLSHFLTHALTRIDIGVLSLVALSGLWGLMRGLATEISGLFSWVMAFLVMGRFHAFFEPYLLAYLHDPWFVSLVSTGLVFVMTLLVLAMVTSRIAALARGSLLGGVDRLLGGGYGLLRGYVLVVVLFWSGASLLGTTMTTYLMQGSLTSPYIVAGEACLAQYIPSSWRSHLASSITNSHDASLKSSLRKAVSHETDRNLQPSL